MTTVDFRCKNAGCVGAGCAMRGELAMRYNGELGGAL
jgi:hypothetical protein